MLLEAENVFSEKTMPISELVEGSPDRPLREPALVSIACLFNGFQIYQMTQILPQLATWDPWGFGFFYSSMMAGIVVGLIWWYVAFCIILLIGAGLVYFINRRAGGALILVISIIGLLVGFVGSTYTFIFTFSLLSLFIGLLSPVFGLLAGISGVRGEKARTLEDVHEII